MIDSIHIQQKTRSLNETQIQSRTKSIKNQYQYPKTNINAPRCIKSIRLVIDGDISSPVKGSRSTFLVSVPYSVCFYDNLLCPSRLAKTLRMLPSTNCFVGVRCCFVFVS